MVLLRNEKFTKFSKPTHKVNILKSKVFKLPNKSRKIVRYHLVQK